MVGKRARAMKGEEVAGGVSKVSVQREQGGAGRSGEEIGDESSRMIRLK
jgi:hypothetical protein